MSPRDLITYYERAHAAAGGSRSGAFAFSFAYVAVIAWLCEPAFGVNDDVAILSDIKRGAPVTFMSPLLGQCLSLLYRHVSGAVPWYGLLVLGTLATSLGFALHAFFQMARFRHLLALVLVLYLCFFPFYVVRTGYNAASFTALGHALFAFLVHENGDRDRLRWQPVVIGCVFALGYLFRGQALLGVLVFSAPVLVLGLFTTGRPAATLRSAGWFVLPLVAASSLSFGFSELSETEELRAFEEFNAYRSRFHGYPVAGLNWNNPRVLEANDWTNDDYAMLLIFMHLSEEKFNVRTMKNVFDHSVPLPSMGWELDLGGLGPLRHRLETRFAPFLWALCVLCALSLATFDYRVIAAAWLYSLYLYGGMTVTDYAMRFPTRIGHGLLLTGALLLVYLVFDYRAGRPRSGGKRPGRVAIPALAGVALLAVSVEQVERLQETFAMVRREKGIYRADMATVNDVCAGKIVMFQAGQAAINFHYMDPLDEDELSFRRVPTGWPIYSPGFYQALRQLGIERAHDVIPRLIDHEDAAIVFQDHALEHFLPYIEQTYGIESRAIELAKLHGSGAIYRLVSR